MNKAFTHAAIAAGAGGLWSYAVIIRERRAREAAERQLAEERARADQEHRQFLALIERLTERLDRDS